MQPSYDGYSLSPQARSMLEELAHSILRNRVQIASDATAQLREEYDGPEGSDPDALWRKVARSLSSGAFHHTDQLLGKAAPYAELHPDTAALVDHLVAEGIPLDRLYEQYRIANRASAERMSQTIADLGLDSRDTAELIRLQSDMEFAFYDELIPLVAERYAAQRARRGAGPRTAATEMVAALLAGQAPETDPAAVLGYDVSGHHVALVGHGPPARTAVLLLGQRLDRRLLVIERDGEVWAWLGGAEALGPEGMRGLLRFRPPEGSRLGVGEPGRGREGFAASHHEARAAATRRSDGVVYHGDVALELLLARDPDRTRAFVLGELAPLVRDRERAGRLFETLRAYFAAGQNAASAAAILGVGARTVSYRLKAIEDALGHPINDRRVELEMALRLRDLLEPGTLPEAADLGVAGSSPTPAPGGRPV